MSEWDSQIPKTIAERADKLSRVHQHASSQLIKTFQINRWGSMVERYGGNLRTYMRAWLFLSEDFDRLTTNIYEGKKGSDLL